MVDLPGHYSFSYAFIWRLNLQFLHFAATELNEIKSLYNILVLIDNPGIINLSKYDSVIVNYEFPQRVWTIV